MIKSDYSQSEQLTCFATQEKKKENCKNKQCRYWQKLNDRSCYNCIILAARKGPFTLQEVGDIFNLTRMRICQIEKNATQTLKTLAPNVLNVIN